MRAVRARRSDEGEGNLRSWTSVVAKNRSTSLIRNTPLLGPYSRAIYIGLYGGPRGGGQVRTPTEAGFEQGR